MAPDSLVASPPSSKPRHRSAPRRGALVAWATCTLAAGLAGPRLARADEAAVHYNLGLQLKRDGKVPDAIAEVEKAVALRPGYAAAHLTLGNLWRTQGNYERAAGEYEKTV